jgi:hypothetical protein
VRHFKTKAQAAGASCAAWARTHKLLAALIPVLVIVLAAGAAIASSGGGNAGTTAASSASSAGGTVGSAASGGAGKSSAGKSGGSGHGGSVAVAGKQVHVPVQPAVTTGEKWLTGPAGKLLSAVNTDVGKISADQRAGNGNAAKSLGTLLITDAEAALDGPMPPVRAAAYRTALGDFEQIGRETVSGKFASTSSLLTTANIDVMRVTTAVNVEAPVNSAAQVNDPNDG